MGDNYSIWTSWTKDKNGATHFAKGPQGNSSGIVLTKEFKITEVTLNTSETAKKMDDALQPPRYFGT